MVLLPKKIREVHWKTSVSCILVPKIFKEHVTEQIHNLYPIKL